MMPLAIIVEGSLVWNFEFRSSGYVCDLVFGAWSFHDMVIDLRSEDIENR